MSASLSAPPPTPGRSTRLRRAARALRREAWVIFIGLLALATRLFWNVVVHPPRNYLYSDMLSYFDRADDVVREPLTATHDYLAFYPWGTHAYLGLAKLLFTTPETCPRMLTNRVAAAGCVPMDIAMALPGAIGVVYTTLIARRLTRRTAEHAATGRRRWVYVVIGLASVFYYPLLAQGGYFLSEPPFFACLAAATFHALRLADEGKTRDAVLLGVVAGIGAWVRPQMLMSIGLLGLFWLFRRRQLPGVTLKKLAVAGVPLALLLAFSAVRTTRHARVHDKDEFALVSTNGPLNWAFGRCHMIGIEARTRNYRAGFGPPSLGSLWFGAAEARKKKRPVYMELYPALPHDLACDVNKKHRQKKEPTEPCVLLDGKMWSHDLLGDLADRCVKKTGLARQAYYGLTHVVLNFGFNWMWPDYGGPMKKARVFGRFDLPYGGPMIRYWQIGFGASVLPFGLIACVLAFLRRRARDGLLAMHLWASTVVAFLYFGETRLRTPYDFVFLILGFDLMARIARWLGRRLRAVTAR